MIKYISSKNELEFVEKVVPQNSGDFVESVEIENYDNNNQYFLEFKCPNNRRFISQRLKMQDNVGSVELPNKLVNAVGKVYVQLVMRNYDGIVVGKSILRKVAIYRITPSINAEQYVDLEKVGDCLSEVLNVRNSVEQIQMEQTKKLDILQNKCDKNSNDLISTNSVLSQVSDKLNRKNDVDILFEGYSDNVKISNYRDYKVLCFVVKCGGSQLGAMYIVGNYPFVSSAMGACISNDRKVAFCIQNDNTDTFKVAKIGYFDENGVWLECQDNQAYQILCVYGIKKNI